MRTIPNPVASVLSAGKLPMGSTIRESCALPRKENIVVRGIQDGGKVKSHHRRSVSSALPSDGSVLLASCASAHWQSSHSRADDPNLLVLLIDTNPFFWSGCVNRETEDYQSVLSQLLMFLNAFLLSKRSNRVAAIASGVFER